MAARQPEEASPLQLRLSSHYEDVQDVRRASWSGRLDRACRAALTYDMATCGPLGVQLVLDGLARNTRELELVEMDEDHRAHDLDLSDFRSLRTLRVSCSSLTRLYLPCGIRYFVIGEESYPPWEQARRALLRFLSYILREDCCYGGEMLEGFEGFTLELHVSGVDWADLVHVLNVSTRACPVRRPLDVALRVSLLYPEPVAEMSALRAVAEACGRVGWTFSPFLQRETNAVSEFVCVPALL